KGVSAMVELREAEQLAHDMESCLRAFGARDVIVSTHAVDTLVDGVQAFERVVAARRARTRIPSIAEPVRRLATLSAGLQSATPSVGTVGPSLPESGPQKLWKVTFTPTPDLVDRGIKVDTIRGRLAQRGRIDTVVPRVVGGGIAFDFVVASDDGSAFAEWANDGVQVDRLPDTAQVAAVASDDKEVAHRTADAGAASASMVRVDLARLDDLMRLVGDLVVSRARLEDSLARIEPFAPGARWRDVQEHSETLERRLRDLRDAVMRVRLVPVGEIFRRMPFVVRDLARDTGKRIRLDLVGESTEIDKFLIERMMDPVVHLVRNAVSHGIESPDERTAAGKMPEGTIRLAAATIGDSVVLEISDDGRGLDVEAITRRARGAGMVVPDGVDPQMLLDIIAAPGFSTRDEADRASGRGVGMAVVRDTIQELGGTLTLDTTAGQRTAFRIVLPVTLAITDAMIVHVGDRVFAVPQSSVREVGEVDPGAIRALENNELVTHRGYALPVIRLARMFAISASGRARLHVLVVGDGASSIGILVDRIAGQREIVVKTIVDPLAKVPGVSGATELGDGRPVLILDLPALTRLAHARRPAQPAD
ncbi:MAG TPA: chemotaxis protein CheA, partial [Vicinamibacterales bacterium]|nr:chemotaxis protein CheA [Vicinamibacterales bacterium]